MGFTEDELYVVLAGLELIGKLHGYIADMDKLSDLQIKVKEMITEKGVYGEEWQSDL